MFTVPNLQRRIPLSTPPLGLSDSKMTLGNKRKTIIFPTIRSERTTKPKSKSGMQEITYRTHNLITSDQVYSRAHVRGRSGISIQSCCFFIQVRNTFPYFKKYIFRVRDGEKKV